MPTVFHLACGFFLGGGIGKNKWIRKQQSEKSLLCQLMKIT